MYRAALTELLTGANKLRWTLNEAMHACTLFQRAINFAVVKGAPYNKQVTSRFF